MGAYVDSVSLSFTYPLVVLLMDAHPYLSVCLSACRNVCLKTLTMNFSQLSSIEAVLRAVTTTP